MNQRLSKLSLLAIVMVSLSACLQTRETQKEQEEKQVLRKTVTNLQQNTADINARFQDIEEDVRRANGRIEGVEARQQQWLAKNEKGASGVETKMRERDEAYREEFAKLNGEITRLREQVTALQEEQKRATHARAAADASKSSEAAKNPFKTAEDLFDKKDWKEAILSYEKYRSQNPKGKSFPVATYKIGVSFQELGMSDEAQAFYEEVIGKFPKSKEAAKAATRLKGMKTKKQ